MYANVDVDKVNSDDVQNCFLLLCQLCSLTFTLIILSLYIAAHYSCVITIRMLTTETYCICKTRFYGLTRRIHISVLKFDYQFGNKAHVTSEGSKYINRKAPHLTWIEQPARATASISAQKLPDNGSFQSEASVSNYKQVK